MTTKCPTCERKVEPPPQNKTFPFCTERCRTIDLGRWLGEDFRLASKNSGDDEDGEESALPVLPTDIS
jgi:uncharacterized protein